jgi:hypothetical protein
VKVKTRKYVIGLAVIFGLPYVLIFMVKAVMGLVTPGMSATQEHNIWMARTLSPSDSLLWILLTVQFAAAAILSLLSWDELKAEASRERRYYRSSDDKPEPKALQQPT